MFEISRDTILTVERHASFLRVPSRDIDMDYDEHFNNVARFAEKARKFVADPENSALGLASNQVGSKYSWFVMKMSNDIVRIIFNPKIYGRSGHKQHEEGCFSEPECDERVKRSRSISASFWEVYFVDGKVSMLHCDEDLEGRDAQVFQHEYDHLKGRLIADKKKKVTKKGWF